MPPPSRSSCRPSPSSAPPPGPGCSRRRCATGSGSPATSTTTRSATSCTILHRSARLLGVEADEPGIAEVAGRSRGTPRIANRLLRRVRDWAQVHGEGHVDRHAARQALALFDVDEAGLDRLDRAVLDALCRRFGGGPVGLSTLAVAVGEESDTVETVAEPYLVREGYVLRTPRGRAATTAAWTHLGLEVPPARAAQPSLPLGDDGPGRLGG